MAEEKKKKTDDGLAAKVRKLEETLKTVTNFLEDMFRLDLDGDGHIGRKSGNTRLTMLLSVALFVSACMLVQSANEVIWNLRNTTNTADVASVDAEGDAIFNSVTAPIIGDITGDVTMSVTAANWTDGSTNTVAAGTHLISGTGGANDTTNTVVLANPAAAGDLVYIVMAAGTTNLITIADSGNVAASDAILLDANDAVTLLAATTSLWVEVGGSDN